ncbi:MAG: acyl-ACP--UDP-N-acetylglucosamine O-acyltransferase [Fuerstiella sp.]|nr:acyl-ACP--UDP-N-acetylglucosamine O-acyltransferase [Fuerstiella sp.]MCP4853857.1 acyl-ACP--UDP-N-acetylglucosamine O-acyltransferase [Fuerstiella sp.]
MEPRISPLSQVASTAQLGKGVVVGPFCMVGPEVVVGDFTELTSHVVLNGKTTLGSHNKLHPGCVIGGEPQDVSYQESATEVVIGDNNIFREGVTVNRGAEKEDHVTRIGHRNMFMSNSHVAHNCRIHNDVILVNGVLLGGHVHVHDRAIVSGNTVVHHFSTIGRLSFVSGGCRVPHDIPPFMLAAGSDNPTLKTINIVGMRRAGISEHSIEVIRTAFRMLYRKRKTLAEVHQHFDETLDGVRPLELSQLLQFIEAQRAGKLGRAREVGRAPAADGNTERKAA